ncbi:MAG: putative lipoprotein [Sediminicola sp.]|jgi:predicted lipoprotein|tara:strand:+ start:67 stop:1179 length:1113 start_codon:yes stop_codon:yes gene_type:complete
MKYTHFAIVFSVLLFLSCGGDDTTEEPTSSDTFNRSAMLVHWADNFILPGYTALETSLSTLSVATEDFVTAPSASSLAEARSSWLSAYQAFQTISMFEIGRAEQLNFRNRLNVYPTNTEELDGLVLSGAWDLGLPSTIDVQGFPAVDYLLHGLGTDEEIIAFFAVSNEADNYKAYFRDLVQTMQTLTTEVKSDWDNGFRETYISNTSSSASGAVDQTVNAFLFYYEKALRAGKVGIPAGVFSGSPLPQNVEALYSQENSKQLLENALTGTQNFFNGSGVTGTNGTSLKAYLDALNAVKNESDLSSLINAQFEMAQGKITGLQTNFVAQIESDNSKMLETYDELQRNVILMKVDMLQALSIDINYVDADGD